MIKYNLVKIILFYSSLFLFISTYSHASSEPMRIGYAYDKSSKELLYIEKHYQINNSNGMPLHAWVIYTDKDGNQIAGKTNNFSRDLLMPDFHLKNHQTGHIESVREKSGDLIVSFISNSDSKLKEKILEKSSDGIIDAGFDNAVIESWGRIIIGEVIEKNFLIPSMMRFIRFRIYQSEIKDVDGKKLRQINIEPANFIARAFAGTTYLAYECDTPLLREYNGTSNMRNASGKNLDVVIRYEDYETSP